MGDRRVDGVGVECAGAGGSKVCGSHGGAPGKEFGSSIRLGIQALIRC